MLPACVQWWDSLAVYQCHLFLSLQLENVEPLGVVTFLMLFPIIFRKVFRSLGKIIYIYIKIPCIMHLHDVVKYVYCFGIPFINSICIRALWKVSYIALMVPTLPGPKYSRFMDMFLFRIEFWLIISACHFKGIILTYCFISHSQGGFI